MAGATKISESFFINGRFLGQRITGVQRYAREVIRAATEGKLWEEKAAFLAPADLNIPDSFCGIPVRHVGKLKGHAWEQLELPRASGNAPIINLCNTAPMFRRKQLAVLHDASFMARPEGYTRTFRLWYQAMVNVYGRRAQQIATVSQYSADDIAKYFGILRSKIEVLSESGEHILREKADYSLHKKHGLEQDDYFLAVSSLAPNKNFAGVLKAVALMPSVPCKFVIVGARNTKIFNSADMDTSGAIEVGYVTDGQLRALYERAACFVYPSFYEGFGLPPLEAMSCGCPVLVARTSSLPEICGEGAAYCDPYSPEDIARQLSRLLNSPEARQELRAAGHLRAAEWTWAKAAQRLNDVISRI